MKYLVLLVLLLILLSNNGFTDLASNSQMEDTRLTSNSKIQPILLQWQASDNPAEFSKINGLEYRGEQIQIYIYLTNEEFLSKLPPEINVIASDQKIAVAYVSPYQLDEFENLDYVERVTLPDLAKTPPLPQIVTKDEITKEEQKDLTSIAFLAIVIVVISVILFVFLNRKKSKNRLDA